MARSASQSAARQSAETIANRGQRVGAAKNQVANRESSRRDWQQAYGNQALQRLLLTRPIGISRLQRKCASWAHADDCSPGFIQTKLKITEPDDAFEQEADRTAEAVVRGDTVESRTDRPGLAAVQRACLCGGTCKDCRTKDQQVQRAANGAPSGGTAPPIVTEVLGSPGSPLDHGTRQFMESRFGADFGEVRLHTDAKADQSARTVDALAYTVGRDIVFSGGQFAPRSASGQKLLAHELSHVVQQGAAGRYLNASRTSSSGLATGASLQRACNPSEIGHPACPETDPSHQFVDGLLFQFNINCDDLAKGADEQLASLGKALRPDSKISIHGYASTDGPKDFNENLACARALKAKSVLIGGGILESSIAKIISHGPTPGPMEKRRSVTLVIEGPTPKKEAAEPREVPAAVDVKTTKSGEEPPSGPAKPPVVKVNPGTVVLKTPDKSAEQKTPEPPEHLVEFGGEVNIKTKHLFKGTVDPALSAFCRNAEIEGQLHATLKVDGFGVGKHLKLFYHEPQFSLSFFPGQCGKPSEAKIEVDVVNLEVVPKILEFALKPGLTLAGTELQPGASFEGQFKPWGTNNNFLGHIKITGELQVQSENDPVSGKKETTWTGTLGAGVEF